MGAGYCLLRALGLRQCDWQWHTTTATIPDRLRFPWQYDRDCCTGLGDLLGVYFSLAALGRAAQRRIEYVWCERGRRTYSLSHVQATLDKHGLLSPWVEWIPESAWLAATVGALDIAFSLSHRHGWDAVYAGSVFSPLCHVFLRTCLV